MYLKSLEIQGFKSFPDKTVLQFGDDITAIVGPNGSGKSNISDAIRWVMGEQSTRALRGAKMEDVIFGGTQKRPQLGFAEASLIFDNADRYFMIDNDEVMVTRRYYRSGENEFYINKQSVRLKDVNELFMDTGLGREGYSNISQGRIDEILSVKSTDRREVFEEAAGISKYRHRKEETERRLERTEDNLLRLGDKISELELQVEPLREQSEKAKKYLALRDELKGVEIALWLQSLDRLAASARKAEEDYSAAAYELQRGHQELEGLYARSEELSEALHRRDETVEARRQAIDDAQAEVRQLEGEKTVREGEKKNVLENLYRLQQEMKDQDDRSDGILGSIAERNERIAAIGREEQTLQTRLTDIEGQIKALEDSSEGMNRSFLRLRTEHAACTAELAARRADAAALRQAADRAEERLCELKADDEAAARRKTEAEQRLSSCEKELKAAADEAQSNKNMLTGYELRRKAREEKAEALRSQLQEKTVQLRTAESKQKLLAEMERDYEGYSKAVRFVMRQAEGGVLRNVHGPVSRLISTEDRYSVAVEIALGAAMQNVVVSSEEDGKAAIQLLKARDAGRATFLPMTAIEGKELSERGLESCPGYLGVASELVSCEDRYLPIVRNLLGRTVITETLNDAVSMAKKYRSRFKIVTLDGQVMNPGGSMTGGSSAGSAGVLSRANELRRLNAEVKRLRSALEEGSAALAEAERQRDLVLFEMTAVQDSLRRAEDNVLRLEGERKQYSVLLEAVEEAARVNHRELEALTAQHGRDSDRISALDAECTQIAARQDSLQAKLDELTVVQSELTRQGTALADDLTSVKLKLSALAAEKETARENLRQMEDLSKAMEGDRAQKQGLIASMEADIGRLDGELKQTAGLIAAGQEQVSARREEWQQALADRAAVEAERTANDRSAQQKNKDILDMEREAARLEARKNAAHMEEKQIIDKLWDSYELTPSTAPAHAGEIESAVAANRRVAELRRKISALGTPNLGAIEEYERVFERYSYLTGQRDDVLGSKRELEGIIRDVTRQMTSIFTEEFAKINRYFSETFVEMFRGGKASLELEDENDPLGCGIEIKVQPPGKQLKTITLLSGGEKAFVAIALYFAILKVRPTPFCMLDEIDAALDELNVERFASYLRQLCRKTQFIVITHRRGTMEEADALFGVTMQEQGVSKLLHLNLDELEKELRLDAE